MPSVRYTPIPRTEMFSVSRQTVLKWINNGKIKAVKVVKVYRIPKEEIDRLIDKQRKEDGKNDR
jgi:excisionase family DNA binding protein